MKHQMHKTLCENLGLNRLAKLTCKTVFEENILSALIVSDGQKSYTLHLNTAPFAIAKSIFNINERIRAANFQYSMPPFLLAA